MAVEMAFVFARYMYGTPEMRRKAYDQLWSYVLAWVAIAGIIAVWQSSRELTAAIAAALGINKLVYNPSPSFFNSLLEQETASWVPFLLLSSFVGLGGAITKIVSFQYMAFEWFMADLAILYVLYLYWWYFTKYGLFAITASLIIPRSTRSIGATLTAYYVVLNIALPILLGIVLIEMPYTKIGLIKLPCNVMTGGITCLAQAVGTFIGYLFTMLGNVLGMSYVNGFHAMVWDILLDVAYALTWLFAYWLARLIDSGAFRLLESVTS